MTSKTFLTNKSERTFLNLLDAAIELFQTRGFHNTSMRDLSRESGLALGAIYYYCRSKEELVFLFYERANEQIRASYIRREDSSKSLGEAFVAYLNIKMSKLVKYRKLLTIVLKESFDPESDLSPLNSPSTEFRNRNVAVFDEMAKKYGGDEPIDGRLLWLLHMGILAFWLYDRSEKYVHTENLLKAVTSMLALLPALRYLPGAKQVTGPLSESLLALLR